MSLLINGRQIANTIKNELKDIIIKHSLNPGLGIILVGNRPDSQVYVRMKKKACEKIGITNFDINLDESVSQTDIINEIEKMNQNSNIHGILVQLPLPKHINEREVLNCVSLNKDVDGFHSTNIGKLALKELDDIQVPCTPDGCLELLKRYNIQIEGKHAVIIGRSNIVGMPLSLLLLHNNATITICHSRTQNLKEITQKADILICAFGSPMKITSEYVKEDCVIIDIGINQIDDSTRKRGYRLVGDVDFEDVKDKVKAITPVPGGVGPMTIAMLLKHTTERCIKSIL